ncbi:MAG: sigma-70 family RNA polymerase sigma factor [Burkholderiaceae bacterium]|nr:sigma-70 family RNA polymerase sigma factor [Burkholderiaceae bacterium]
MTSTAASEPDVPVQPEETSTADPRMLRVMMAAAAYHARKVARTMRLSDVDREDVEQDILLVLLERRRFFDPARGAWSSFADRVARQAAQGVADDIGAERRVRGGSLDQPTANDGSATLGELMEDHLQGPDSEQALQLSLALAGFVAGLPDELALVARLSLLEDGDLAEAQRRSGLSTSEFYRRLREVRYRLVCLDIVRHRFSEPREE